MPRKHLASLLVAASILGTAALPFPASACDPACGVGVNLGLSLRSPFPDTHATEKDWVHAAGSTFHCGKDCFAVDLNWNPSGLGVSPSNMDYLQPVLAVSNGTVALAQYDDPTGYGNLVRINHGNSFQSLYAHMDPILMVRANQQVKTGQVIGFISNTSTSSFPHHLHFALRNGDNSQAAWASLDGTSMQNAPTTSTDFSSASNQFFEDEFEVTDPAGAVGWPAPLTKSGGFATLPAGTWTSLFRHMLHARSGKAPYIAEYAVQLEPKMPPSGFIRLGLRTYNFGLHPDRDNPSITTDIIRQSQGDRYTSGFTTNTRQGWELFSDIFDFSELPAATRFIQPIIQTSGFGGGRMDWLRIEESPASRLGGAVRLNAYNRGGATQLTWSITDTTSISSFQILRATSKTGTYSLLATISPSGTSYSYKDRSLTLGASYFYKLVIQQAAGVPRTLGPLGPVATYIVQNIPNLGWCRIYSDMADIPDWSDYPGLSFDSNLDTYGLINYNPNQVRLYIIPDTPVSLSRIEAYLGGNTNNWGGEVVEIGTGVRYSIGQTSNTSLNWSLLPVNRGVQQIDLWFQRTNGDRFFHNAELRFVR